MESKLCAIVAALAAFTLSYNNQSDYTTILILFIELFIAQYAVILLYNVFIYPFYRSPLRHLPGPKVPLLPSRLFIFACLTNIQDGHFLFGQTLKFIQAESGHSMPLQMMRENPDAPLIRYTHVGNTEWVLLNSVKACREMLTTKCYAFEKPVFFRRVIGELTGVGLANSEGREHMKQRRLLNGTKTR